MSAAARTLFDLGGAALPTKAPARKAPVRRAQIALPHVPGRAPWEGRERELGFPPSRPVGVVTGPSPEAWARFAEDRERSLQLGAEARALPYAPNEYRAKELEQEHAEWVKLFADRERQRLESLRRYDAVIARSDTKTPSRERYAPSDELGTVSARVAAHEPASRGLAGAEAQPLWTEGGAG
jgi:hypothetical protein